MSTGGTGCGGLRLGRLRSLRICSFSHQSHSPRVAGERDIDPASPVRFSVCLAVRWRSDCRAKSHPAPPQRDRPRHVRPGSVGSDAQLDVPDQIFSTDTLPDFGRAFGISSVGTVGSGGTPEKRLGFFGFLSKIRWDTVTHNPLVPGSSPGGPTISIGIHRVMSPRAGDSSPLV